MSFNCFYRAWDVSTNSGKAGDAANHTIAVEVDDDDVTGLTKTEVGNGVYRVTLSDAQCPAGSRFAVHGSSSTGTVEIVGETGIRPAAVNVPNTEAIAEAVRIKIERENGPLSQTSKFGDAEDWVPDGDETRKIRVVRSKVSE